MPDINPEQFPSLQRIGDDVPLPGDHRFPNPYADHATADANWRDMTYLRSAGVDRVRRQPRVWDDVPVEHVDPRDLHHTQSALDAHSLHRQMTRTGPPAPAGVVEVEGRRYIQDGHHRVIRALADGAKTMPARVWRGESR